MKNYKVIEFFGMPGAGKSTICSKIGQILKTRNINHKIPAHEIDLMLKRTRVFIKVYFILKYTVYNFKTVLTQIYLIRQIPQKTFSNYSKTLSNWLYINSLIHFNNYNYIILDQGLFQAIWSLCMFQYNKAYVVNLLKGIRLPDIVIVVNIEKNLIIERLKNRKGKQSRLEQTSDIEAIRLVNATHERFNEIVEILENEFSEIKLIRVDNNKYSDLNRNVKYLINSLFN